MTKLGFTFLVILTVGISTRFVDGQSSDVFRVMDRLSVINSSPDYVKTTLEFFYNSYVQQLNNLKSDAENLRSKLVGCAAKKGRSIPDGQFKALTGCFVNSTVDTATILNGILTNISQTYGKVINKIWGDVVDCSAGSMTNLVKDNNCIQPIIWSLDRSIENGNVLIAHWMANANEILLNKLLYVTSCFYITSSEIKRNAINIFKIDLPSCLSN